MYPVGGQPGPPGGPPGGGGGPPGPPGGPVGPPGAPGSGAPRGPLDTMAALGTGLGPMIGQGLGPDPLGAPGGAVGGAVGGGPPGAPGGPVPGNGGLGGLGAPGGPPGAGALTPITGMAQPGQGQGGPGAPGSPEAPLFVCPRRPNIGRDGRPITLRANHFQISMRRGYIHHYAVNIQPDKVSYSANTDSFLGAFSLIIRELNKCCISIVFSQNDCI